MKKIIYTCLCIFLASGCDRLHNGGNAANFDAVSEIVVSTPLQHLNRQELIRPSALFFAVYIVLLIRKMA
ncbi:MAG: hypothetical protein LE169_01610 [Endomicrobium sp.]|nr:hypothetical protein [Endomicrobium sp.]